MSGRESFIMSFAFALALVACGADDGGVNVNADGSVDASSGGAVEITCTSTSAATVTTSNGVDRYSPEMSTITQGQVVKFSMSPDHNVAPRDATSDQNLKVGYGRELCFRFTKTGTFSFQCTTHSFRGSITVN